MLEAAPSEMTARTRARAARWGIESSYPSGPALPDGQKRTGPPSGGRFFAYRALRTGLLIFRVADLAFRQSAAGVPTVVAGARARYLPGLPLVFAEYDPVSLVVALAAFFQPPPFFFFWILTGTAFTQSVKGVVSVELTTPLALPLFLSFSVMALVCPVAATQSGGGTRKLAVLKTAAGADVGGDLDWSVPGTRRHDHTE